jgi:hypothetical protein
MKLYIYIYIYIYIYKERERGVIYLKLLKSKSINVLVKDEGANNNLM